MRSFLRTVLVAAALTAGAIQSASAAVLWSNRGSGDIPTENAAGTLFSSAIHANTLEDATFATTGAYSITGINVGYDNTTNLPIIGDILVGFYDNFDYGPTATVVNSGQLGPIYRFPFIAATGANETGLITLTGGPLSIPDESVAVTINFVATGTSTPLPSINHLFRNVPVTVGTSEIYDAFDENNNGIIQGRGNVNGSEVFVWNDPINGFPDANLYFELQGNAVPEPAVASLLVLGFIGASSVRRRRSV